MFINRFQLSINLRRAHFNATFQLSDLEQSKSMCFALNSPLMLMLLRSLLDSEGCVGRVNLWVATVDGFVTDVVRFTPLNFGVGGMGGVGS